MTHHRRPRRPPALVVTADFGTNGPAQLARQSYRVPSDTAGMEYRQMADPGPLQGLQLHARHLEAASTLRSLWRASLAAMVRPSAFRHGVASDDTLDDATAAQAYRDYNDAVWSVQCNAGLRAVMVLRRVVIDQEPTGETATLRLALDALAMHLRL